MQSIARRMLMSSSPAHLSILSWPHHPCTMPPALAAMPPSRQSPPLSTQPHGCNLRQSFIHSFLSMSFTFLHIHLHTPRGFLFALIRLSSCLSSIDATDCARVCPVIFIFALPSISTSAFFSLLFFTLPHPHHLHHHHRTVVAR